MTIRVMLAEDHRMVREALRDTLSKVPDIEVVSEAGSGAEALDQARALSPDVIVLDIGLPDLSGMEVAARLKRSGSAVRIVALSGYTDRRFVTEMLRAGAAGYVTKSAAGTELVRAIRSVASGQGYFCPEIAGALVADVRDRDVAGEDRQLGRREREVLRMVAEGERSTGIAQRLHISVATVEVHRRNIMRKLGLRTVADLTRYAVREGIVAP